jgi:DNA-binding FrmR family transcriptional regulator
MRELRKRLNYVKGQLAGIDKMLDEGRDPAEIYAQLRSIESAFQKSILQTFEEQHRVALAKVIVSELDSCPGACSHCNDLEAVKKAFPRWTLGQVLDALRSFRRKETKQDA